MYQEWTKKDASFSSWFQLYSPASLAEGRSWATRHRHIGSRIAKVSFLLWWSPGGRRIWLSCSGFHILPLSKLNREHISSQGLHKSLLYPFGKAMFEMELSGMLKACLLQPSVLAGPAATMGGPWGRQGAGKQGHCGKFHPCGSQIESKWTPVNVFFFAQ